MNTNDPAFKVVDKFLCITDEYLSGRNTVWLIKWDMQMSLRKWKVLLDLCKEGYLVADGGVETCALCRANEMCKDCLIGQAGHHGCTNTPYEDYYRAVEQGNLPAARKAAQEMVKFLERISEREGI